MIAPVKLTLVLSVTRDYRVFVTTGNVVVTQYIYTKYFLV